MLKDAAKLSLALKALWWDARGDWERAHEVCREAKNRDGGGVHAYLHRKEGDAGNASHWYARAGQPMPAETVTSAEEWSALSKTCEDA